MRYLRLADRPAPSPTVGPGPQAGLSPFAGLWATTNPSLRGIGRWHLSEGESGPKIRALGKIEEGFVDWGDVAVAGCFAGSVSSTALEGLTASFDLGSVRCRLQVNLKLGVAVAGAFAELAGAGERRRLFTRDFLARPAGGEPPDQGSLLEPTEDRVRQLLGTPPPARLEPFAGSWLNTAQPSRGIVRLDIAPDGEEATVRLFGAGPRGLMDWGRSPGQVYPCVEEDEVESACIWASYDFGFMASELQVRRNKGILAVTTFNTFQDGSGRSSYVQRELFHQ